jgi:hypothetical protein
MDGWQIAVVGVVLTGLMGVVVASTMAADETAALQEQTSGLGLGFEPRSLTAATNSTVTTMGNIHRVNHHRPIALAVDLQAGIGMPGGNISLAPAMLEVGDANAHSYEFDQPFEVTLSIAAETPPGTYEVWIRADDGAIAHSSFFKVIVAGRN